MLAGLSRSPFLRRCPSGLLVPCSALAILAAGMLLVSAIVSGYAFFLASTHGGTIDPALMTAFGHAAGRRLGPAFSLALALPAARWLVAERGLGYGAVLALAALLAALGAGIGRIFGYPPDAGEAAVGLVFAGATTLGGWLGHRAVAEAAARRRFIDALGATSSFGGVARALSVYLGPDREVDLYADARATPRWLAGSTDEPPAPTPPPEALVACGGDGHAVAVRGEARPHRILDGVADAIGVHLQRLALRSEGERAGVLAERERLAGDIHDTMAQSLAAVTTHLEAAASALPQRSADAARHLLAATGSARTALAELRGLVWALRPATERVPLCEALQRCIDRTAMESGLSVDSALETPGVELSPEVELCLLRAAQEGLRNAVRHAAAAHLGVALAPAADRIVLTVEDDGRGFDPAAPPPVGPDHGHGLCALARRVERLGGDQEILSSPGRGTRLVVRLPLRRGERSRP